MEEENGNGELTQMTPEQLAERLEAQTIIINKAYMAQLKHTLDFIDELDKKPDKDRLRYANIIGQLIGILIGSIKGWQSWLNFNSMDSLLSLEEMSEIVPKMKKLVKEWIEIDLLITEVKTGNVEKSYEEKRTKKTKGSKTTYVS
jgi:hypothetical protein